MITVRVNLRIEKMKTRCFRVLGMPLAFFGKRGDFYFLSKFCRTNPIRIVVKIRAQRLCAAGECLDGIFSPERRPFLLEQVDRVLLCLAQAFSDFVRRQVGRREFSDQRFALAVGDENGGRFGVNGGKKLSGGGEGLL